MSTRQCENCQTACGPDDMFCENCGYDFITGSLPAAGEGDAPAPAPVPAPGSDPAGEPLRAPSMLRPDSASGPDSAGAAPGSTGAPAGADVTRIRLTVGVDRSFFDQMVNDDEIDFPDPVPAAAELELAGPELHIGRTSDSRAIHPDIDVADLTGDQAVSSRHAVIRVGDDGHHTVTDVGSTNGTFLDAVDSEAISVGTPIEIKAGTSIFVGAWTRISVVD